MRFIQKGQEPQSFAEWKQQANSAWQPQWNNFQKPQKLEVHAALLNEQGYLCCYCGQRIAQPTSHIEHLQPRTHYPTLSLTYSNLLASCPGYPEEEEPQPNQTKPPQEFCGQKKGDWHDSALMVSPLMPDCADYFRYTGAGEILPTQAPTMMTAAAVTIEKLGLNHPKLEASRRKAIEGILVNFEQLTEEDIRKLIADFDQPDVSGQLTPFCAAVIYTLQQLLP
jgi:uncharacterized protein (TIGR02646 family)